MTFHQHTADMRLTPECPHYQLLWWLTWAQTWQMIGLAATADWINESLDRPIKDLWTRR